MNEVSYGTFLKLKPFYIHGATAKDIELCCCKAHIEARNFVAALMLLTLPFSNYNEFFFYLYGSCKSDNLHVEWMCSPDTKIICADILKRWENLKCMLLETSQNESKVTLMYFEKREITLKSSKVTERVLPIIHAYVNIIELLEFFDAPSGKQTKSRLTKTIHHRNLLRNFRNLKQYKKDCIHL